MITNLRPLLVSLKLSFATPLCLLLLSFPAAYFISFKARRLELILKPIFNLPMVIPPTVLGFYLLIILSPGGGVGKIMDKIFGLRLIFNFPAILTASCIYSFPLMLNPLVNGLKGIPGDQIDASYSLGKSRIETFFLLIVPQMKHAIFSGVVTTFSHTMGAFGIILMIGGNIPGETKTISIAVYEMVEEINYTSAHLYSIILISISLVFQFLLSYFSKERPSC